MSAALTSVNNIPTTGAVSEASPAATSSQTTAFNQAVNTNAISNLTVTSNQVDTGRYVISASNTYTLPTDGASKEGDGMVSIYDKKTNSYVDIYGDPHVYTSAGDMANFEKNGLQIQLGDGTKVDFNPTALSSTGVSDINSVDVVGNNGTAVMSGFNVGGNVSTSPIYQAGPMDDPQNTVLHTGQDGSLGTLYNAAGSALNSTTTPQSLDGMGGASTSITPQQLSDIQKLISQMQQQISAGQASGQNTQRMQDLVSGLEQLVSTSMGTGSGGNMATLVNNLLPGLETQLAQLGQSGQGNSQEASLINGAISTLMGTGNGGTTGGSASVGTGSSATGTGASSTGGTSSSIGSAGATNPYSANFNPATSGMDLFNQAINSALDGSPGPNYEQYMQAVANYGKNMVAQSAAQAAATAPQNGQSKS